MLTGRKCVFGYFSEISRPPMNAMDVWPLKKKTQYHNATTTMLSSKCTYGFFDEIMSVVSKPLRSFEVHCNLYPLWSGFKDGNRASLWFLMFSYTITLDEHTMNNFFFLYLSFNFFICKSVFTSWSHVSDAAVFAESGHSQWWQLIWAGGVRAHPIIVSLRPPNFDYFVINLFIYLIR